MPAAATHIYLPSGAVKSIPEARVDIAVREYDPLLRFGRNEDTGQWCIFLIKRGDAPLPVLGFDEIPHPEDALKRLHKADTLRQGKDMLEQMERENKALNEPLVAAAEDAEWLLAEHFDHLLRKQGKTPYSRVYLGERTGNRMGGWL